LSGCLYSSLAYRILLLVKVLSLRHFFQLGHIQGRDPAHKKSSVHKKCGVADPDPISDAFLTPGSGIWMGKKLGSGSGMNILYHIFESLETIFWLKILKFFDADPNPGSGIFLTLNPG
jgi:hypothetical protein